MGSVLVGRALLIALLIAPALPAQPIPLGRMSRPLAEMLRSERALDVARAASIIAASEIRGHRNALLATLQSWGERNDPDAVVVRLHLLDALVRSGAKVPGPLVFPHIRGATEVPAFVLLARDTSANERELFALFRQSLNAPTGSRSIAWRAAGELLAQLRTPGFAYLLLEHVDFGLDVDVIAVGQAVGARCGGCRVVGLRDQLQAQPGFPKLPAYSFIEGEHLERRLLSAWPCRIGWRRELGPRKIFVGPSYDTAAGASTMTWLYGMAELEPPEVYRRYRLRSRAGFRRDLGNHRAALMAHQRKLLAGLVRHRALTEAEAARHEVRVPVRLCDLRPAGSDPLPVLEP